MFRLTYASLFVLALTAPASAHFKLISPTNVAEQQSDGDPQKSAPCGIEDDPFTPSNVVTDLLTGDNISIKIDEVIFHPGHYRVSLAPTMADLPADPPVTEGNSECGSTVIDDTPELPLLADGLLRHTSEFSSEQTMRVQLPAGMQCESCVLQVVEFMSSHDAPCYYHHCAMVKISDTAMPNPDPDPGDDDPGTGPADDTGCAAGGSPRMFASLALLGLALVRRRRR